MKVVLSRRPVLLGILGGCLLLPVVVLLLVIGFGSSSLPLEPSHIRPTRTTEDRVKLRAQWQAHADAEAARQIEESDKLAQKLASDKIRIRQNYPYLMRNFFLDRGLNIEMAVSGEQAEKIEFQYILAGPVLGRRFETLGLIEELKRLGFTLAVLKDEHTTYFQSWDLRSPEVQEAEEEAKRAEARRIEAEEEKFRRTLTARYVEDKKHLAEWQVRYRVAAEDIRRAIRSLTTIGPGATGCQRLRLALDANRHLGSPPDSALSSDSSRAIAATEGAIRHCERGDADGTRVDIVQAMMLLDKVDFRLNALGIKNN
jgi:hypothetical protein